jgi:hypothetical protein
MGDSREHARGADGGGTEMADLRASVQGSPESDDRPMLAEDVLAQDAHITLEESEKVTAGHLHRESACERHGA